MPFGQEEEDDEEQNDEEEDHEKERVNVEGYDAGSLLMEMQLSEPLLDVKTGHLTS